MSSSNSWVLSRVLVAATLALVGAKCTLAADCDEPTARLVARAYIVSNPLTFKPDEFVSFLENNKQALAKNGKAARCMNLVGTKLMSGALSAGASTPSATERFGGAMPEGLEGLPGQVDQNIARWASDTFAMAQELVWLSAVLPAAAGGDFTPFNAQDTMGRKMWREQVFPMFQMVCNLDPYNCKVAVDALVATLPLVEEQVYTFALQLGR